MLKWGLCVSVATILSLTQEARHVCSLVTTPNFFRFFMEPSVLELSFGGAAAEFWAPQLLIPRHVLLVFPSQLAECNRLCIQWYHFHCFILAIVGIFIPWKQANTRNQGFLLTSVTLLSNIYYHKTRLNSFRPHGWEIWVIAGKSAKEKTAGEGWYLPCSRRLLYF